MKLEQAIAFAANAHAGQLDRQDQPYIRHCLRVMEALAPDVEAMVVGVLHDVIEDTPAALDDFNGGDLGHAQFHALRLLTRESGMSYEDYIARLVDGVGPPNTLACRVKLADLADNLRRIDGLRGPKRTLLAARYDAATEVIVKWLGAGAVGRLERDYGGTT